MNKVILVGRIVKDIELKEGTNGNKYCYFTVAIPREKGNNDNPITDFINITAFGKVAENLAKYTGKGSLVSVDAAVHNNNYKDKNGDTHHSLQIIANKVRYLTYPKSEEKLISETDDAEINYEVNMETNGEIINENDVPF